MKSNKSDTKLKVQKYWDKASCGTEHASSDKFTKKYFEEIEDYRYQAEPEIFSFAQFPRFHGMKILEVGVGAGTDFLQWVRSGAKAYGVDLTPEAIGNVKKRLEIYRLKAFDLRVSDCESLPYKDNTFDLVYSWGVIHHTPDTPKALGEIVRTLKPGGRGKIMVYHRYSLVVLFLWFRRAFLSGRPWRSFKWCLANYMESPGTKAYTVSEIKQMLEQYSLDGIKIAPKLTFYDKYRHIDFLPARIIASFLAFILGGDRVGWFLLIDFVKVK